MTPLLPGDPARIGRYELEGRLGAGGMGVVYLGRTPGGRPAAIKVMSPGYLAHPEALTRFRREAATLRTVRSAYTAGLIDAELTTAPYWMATEYVPGPTLAAAIIADGPRPAAEVVKLLAALAEGLSEIHAHGVCHRDIKPQNVILSATGPQLIDFGVARQVADAGLTESGIFMGTLGYTAPELMEDEELTPAADVFALGATATLAATGRRPYGGGTVERVCLRVLREEIDLDGIEPGLAALLRACVARDPASRPSPDAIVERCRAWLTTPPHPTTDTTSAPTPPAAPPGPAVAVPGAGPSILTSGAGAAGAGVTGVGMTGAAGTSAGVAGAGVAGAGVTGAGAVEAGAGFAGAGTASAKDVGAGGTGANESSRSTGGPITTGANKVGPGTSGPDTSGSGASGAGSTVGDAVGTSDAAAWAAEFSRATGVNPTAWVQPAAPGSAAVPPPGVAKPAPPALGAPPAAPGTAPAARRGVPTARGSARVARGSAAVPIGTTPGSSPVTPGPAPVPTGSSPATYGSASAANSTASGNPPVAPGHVPASTGTTPAAAHSPASTPAASSSDAQGASSSDAQGAASTLISATPTAHSPASTPISSTPGGSPSGESAASGLIGTAPAVDGPTPAADDPVSGAGSAAHGSVTVPASADPAAAVVSRATDTDATETPQPAGRDRKTADATSDERDLASSAGPDGGKDVVADEPRTAAGAAAWASEAGWATGASPIFTPVSGSTSASDVRPTGAAAWAVEAGWSTGASEVQSLITGYGRQHGVLGAGSDDPVSGSQSDQPTFGPPRTDTPEVKAGDGQHGPNSGDQQNPVDRQDPVDQANRAAPATAALSSTPGTRLPDPPALARASASGTGGQPHPTVGATGDPAASDPNPPAPATAATPSNSSEPAQPIAASGNAPSVQLPGAPAFAPATSPDDDRPHAATSTFRSPMAAHLPDPPAFAPATTPTSDNPLTQSADALTGSAGTQLPAPPPFTPYPVATPDGSGQAATGGSAVRPARPAFSPLLAEAPGATSGGIASRPGTPAIGAGPAQATPPAPGRTAGDTAAASWKFADAPLPPAAASAPGTPAGTTVPGTPAGISVPAIPTGTFAPGTPTGTFGAGTSAGTPAASAPGESAAATLRAHHPTAPATDSGGGGGNGTPPAAPRASEGTGPGARRTPVKMSVLVAAAVAGVLIAVGGAVAVLGGGDEPEPRSTAAAVPIWTIGLPDTAPPVPTLSASPASDPSSTTSARPGAKPSRTASPPAVSTPTSADGRCIQMPADTNAGVMVSVAACDGSAGQRWVHDAAGRLQHVAGDVTRCLDVGANGGADIGYRVQLWGCNDGGAQQWQHRRDGTLFLSGAGRCLAILDTAALSVQQCTAGPGQVWRMPKR